jgi:hypothetical protein
MAKKDTSDKSKNEIVDKPESDIISVTPEILDDETLTPAEEKKVDHKKVDEAFNELKNILFKGFYKTMLEAGQYLIKTFYDNDYKKAAEKQFKQNLSLHALFVKLENETSGNAPKKTWLYDSINLALAENQFKKVSEFGKLGNSHKLKLISSGLSENIQIALIKDTVEKQYSVLQLKACIDKERSTIVKKTLLSLDMTMPEEKVNKLKIERLEKYIAEIKAFQESFEQKKIIYEANLKTIEQILEKKKANKEKKDKKEKKAADSKTS